MWLWHQREPEWGEQAGFFPFLASVNPPFPPSGSARGLGYLPHTLTDPLLRVSEAGGLDHLVTGDILAD